MSSISWANGVSGDWTTASDWTGGVVPGAGDAVTISAAGPYTVDISGDDAADALTLDQAGAAIADTGVLTMGSTLTLNAGVFQLNAGGEIDGGQVVDNGGAAIQWNGGTLSNTGFVGILDMSAANSTLHVEGGLSVYHKGGDPRFSNIDLTGQGAEMIGCGGTVKSAYLFIGSSTSSELVIDDPAGIGTTLMLKATVLQEGQNAEITDAGGGNDTLVDSGIIVAGYAGGTFTIDTTNFTLRPLYGQIGAENGGTLDLRNTHLTNLRGTTLASGLIYINARGNSAGGTVELPDNSTLATDNSGITLYGANTVLESFSTTSDQFITLESMLDRIGAHGLLAVEGREIGPRH